MTDYGSIQATGTNPKQLHMQTYTAGEDNSRLANMAKEFGLQRHRRPRSQIRERITTPLQALRGFWYERILDPEFAHVRMRSIYTSHYDDDGGGLSELYGAPAEEEEEVEAVMGRPPSWKEDDFGDLFSYLEGGGGGSGGHDPHAEGFGGDLSAAVLGIIKGMVGPAILYLPHGFANAGWAVGVPILIFATILFLRSSSCLLDSWKLESSRITRKNLLLEKSGIQVGRRRRKPRRVVLSYPQLAFQAFGVPGETFVKIGIALMQSGVCLTYLIFVPQNLKKITQILFGYDINASYFMIIMIIFQIPLSWIRDIRKLTITNLIANILILYGLITCLYFAFNNAVKSVDGRGPFEEIVRRLSSLDAFRSGWFLFIGTSVLLFEGSITLLVPLQEAVYREEDREKFPQVYVRVVLGIISFYSFFGIFCWMSFGYEVKTVMTTSLPEGRLATTVQLAYSIAVILTFPLQNFPSLEIATRSITTSVNKACGRTTSVLQQRNVIASFVVCLLALIALSTMESLDKVVSLMGSLLGCPLAFVFPPLIHSNLDPDISHARKGSNYLVASLGMCAMILASVTTLLTW